MYAESLATGAIISGRRTFELAGRWNGDHHDGVPILVLTHHVAEDDVPPGSAHFYTDVRECAAAAREGAGGKDVMVHGAGAARALIRAGELDEIAVHVVPVLLGAGRRLFDGLEDLAGPIELEAVRAVQGRDATTCAIASFELPDPTRPAGSLRRPGPSGSRRRPASGRGGRRRPPRLHARAGIRSRTHSRGIP